MSELESKRSIQALYLIHISGRGVSHAALSVVNYMQNKSWASNLLGITADRSVNSPYFESAIPWRLNALVFRILSDRFLSRIAEKKFLRSLNKNSIVYLWPAASTELYRKISNAGHTIIRENINCHQNISKKILEDEYDRIGVPRAIDISSSSVERENLKHSLTSFIFSPSPMVSKSLIDSGIPKRKIIDSSYGLTSEERFPAYISRNSSEHVNALFVGRVGIRKGVHLLLEYWLDSGVDGVLTVVGNEEESIKPILAKYKSSSKIRFVSYVNDLSEYYKKADMFLMPSLEEGSPLVTYQAIGAGLPLIVSPMAGGGVVFPAKNGFVLDPHDKISWIEAIQGLAGDKNLRDSMGLSSWTLSEEYLWKNVGARRLASLDKKLAEAKALNKLNIDDNGKQ